jgi:serine/threonine-protein kinase
MTFTNQIKGEFPNPGDVIETGRGVDYSIGRLITQGGFGLLYEGQDNFGNSLAIKIFKPDHRKFEEVQRQWESETSILDKVRHQNVVHIYDAFICDNLFYIVFERAWGNLYDLTKHYGSQRESVVKNIAFQLLSALDYIHGANILHKDLTVYNILYFPNGNTGPRVYKISDFGISEELRGRFYSTNQIAHPKFKAPELVKFQYTSFQSDLYHLGIALYFCHTGDFPYDINLPSNEIERAILHGIPRVRAEQLRTQFGHFISILLRRREEYRFQTAQEAWEYLREI